MDKKVAYVYYSEEYKIPCLFIVDVPDETSTEKLKDLVSIKYDYSTLGIPWRDHGISIGLKNAPGHVKRAWMNKECEIISYSDLIAIAESFENL